MSNGMNTKMGLEEFTKMGEIHGKNRLHPGAPDLDTITSQSCQFAGAILEIGPVLMSAPGNLREYFIGYEEGVKAGLRYVLGLSADTPLDALDRSIEKMKDEYTKKKAAHEAQAPVTPKPTGEIH